MPYTHLVNERTYIDLSDEERTISIEGVKLPPCDNGMSFKFSDLDSTGVRSWKTGILKRNRIRANVMSIENMNWTNISVETAQEILQLIYPSKISVSVYDRTQGKRVTKSMYASADKTYRETRTVNGYFATLSFSLIEL